VAVPVNEIDAIVLRSIRYGEADLIGHLYTLQDGRRNVIAKGARKAKSRLGTRLEPFVVARVQLRSGRGDLGIVQGVELAAAHEAVRASWKLQQRAASAIDILGRLTLEGVVNESIFHLGCRFLAELNAVVDESEAACESLLTGSQLKLLHAAGLSPQFASCTRCDAKTGLVAWSAKDGGVICTDCLEPGDQSVDPAVHAAAVDLLQRSLTDLRTVPIPEVGHVIAARRVFVAGMCSEHAGFRPR
jgi:DNA repair protein RecO (recombination protein O)